MVASDTARLERGTLAALTSHDHLLAYDNRGSFALRREDLRAFLDTCMGKDYRLYLAYRDLDYVEDAYDVANLELASALPRLVATHEPGPWSRRSRIECVA